MSDVDQILLKEQSEHGKDVEIDRILGTFQLDAYSVLDLKPGCNKEAIKQQYRKKSLLIHPDKTKNTRAPDAFDKLKKAEAELQNDDRREVLDGVFADARMVLIREKKWTIHDDRLKGDEFAEEWKEKTKDLLIERELRKRLAQRAKMEEQGRLKRKLDEEAEERAKAREEHKAWEDARDTRVSNWRDYKKSNGKKKKKQKLLG